MTVRPPAEIVRISVRMSCMPIGIEAVGRLVEDDELGVAEQGGGDAEPLLHAERVRRRSGRRRDR